MAKVHLRRGSIQPLWAGHPWVYAQAIARMASMVRLLGSEVAVVGIQPGTGDAVTVLDPTGKPLGRGFWSPKSAIPVRILTRDPDASLDAGFLGHRIEAAAALRRRDLSLPSDATTGYRLIHAEGDGLAGLIVDVYGAVATVQLLTAGMKRREDALFGHVSRVAGTPTVIEVGGARTARFEGFEAETRVVRGPDVDALRFRERGFDFDIPMDMVQKTGFYFDQRDNRAMVESLAQGRRVLDAFSYVGAFSLAAARGGAESVLAVDSSAPALATASALAHHASLPQMHVRRADLKRAFPELARQGDRFDLVIVDPPKLVPSTKHLEAGRRAYRKLNAQALGVVDRGGLMLSCSCSAAFGPDDLLRTVALAARDAGRDVTLLRMGFQSPDHPTPPAFPEGRYLKAALVRVE